MILAQWRVIDRDIKGDGSRSICATPDMSLAPDAGALVGPSVMHTRLGQGCVAEGRQCMRCSVRFRGQSIGKIGQKPRSSVSMRVRLKDGNEQRLARGREDVPWVGLRA